MDKWAALQSFWSGFGVPAYDQATVGTPPFPYITYEAAVSSATNSVYLTAALWYRDLSWEDASKKALAIETAIGPRGTRIKTDDGELWITPAVPFARRAAVDPADDMIRRINLMVNVKFEVI